jgi:hypothetical protein
MSSEESMNNKHQENGTPAGPLIFTLPASSFIVILNFDWFDVTKPAAVPAKTHGWRCFLRGKRISVSEHS